MIKKKILFAVLGLILIGLFIGVFFYFKQNHAIQPGVNLNNEKISKLWPIMSQPSNVTKESCKKMDGKEKNDCFIELAFQESVLNNDPKYCLSINDYVLRNDCIFERLVITKDPKQCERIADPEFRDRCQETIGQENLGVKYCDSIKDDIYEKQECKDRYIAMSLNRVKTSSTTPLLIRCDNIETLEYSYLCEINAMKNGSGSCEDLKNKSRVELCRSRVLYAKAKTADDCSKITDEKYKKVCLSIFKNINNKNYKFDDDGDGLTDEKELWINTDPFNADTDGDGLSDFDEYSKYKTDPTKKNNKDKVIAEYNQKENARIGKDLTTDSDNDGLTDADEIFYGTDYKNSDTKKLGMTDGEAVKRGLIKAE